MRLRIFTTLISLLIHAGILYILITIPPMDKDKGIKIQPIMVYVPKSPLSGTPPLYVPKEEEKKSQEKKEERREEGDTLKKRDIPIIVKGTGEEEEKKEKGRVEGGEGTERLDMKGGMESEGKESLTAPDIKQEKPQESGRGYIYSEGIGKKQINFPSGFYFRGQGGMGGEGYQGFAGSAYFDSGGYDITPWAKEVIEKVKRNWLVPIAARYGIKGITGIYVVFERDGNISSMSFFRKSGIISFDQSASNAIVSSIPFPKLPPDFPKENLPAYFFFYYNIPIESQ